MSLRRVSSFFVIIKIKSSNCSGILYESVTEKRLLVTEWLQNCKGTVLKLLFPILLLSLQLFGELSNLNSFQANFKQVVSSDGDKIIYNGKLSIKQPHFVLWEYQTPVEKRIYLNGVNLFLVEPELEQVIIKRVSKGLKMLEVIRDAKKIDKNRYRASVDNRDYLLILEGGKLAKIIYSDELENGVEIEFSNQIENGYISKALFLPEIPDYFDRIYQ
jgi:outer membrane lipoprotein-sorting protein